MPPIQPRSCKRLPTRSDPIAACSCIRRLAQADNVGNCDPPRHLVFATAGKSSIELLTRLSWLQSMRPRVCVLIMDHVDALLGPRSAAATGLFWVGPCASSSRRASHSIIRRVNRSWFCPPARMPVWQLLEELPRGIIFRRAQAPVQCDDCIARPEVANTGPSRCTAP
jgi:hypothetical protein